MSVLTLKEAAQPLETEATPGGHDLKEVSGTQLLTQRITRFLFTVPGELVHRPDWGVGIGRYANKPPIDVVLGEMRNRVKRGLKRLPYVEGFAFEIEHNGAAYTLNISVRVDGDIHQIPEVTIGTA